MLRFQFPSKPISAAITRCDCDRFVADARNTCDNFATVLSIGTAIGATVSALSGTVGPERVQFARTREQPTETQPEPYIIMNLAHHTYGQ